MNHLFEAFIAWLREIPCVLFGHKEARVITRASMGDDGFFDVSAGYVVCMRCTVTLRTWGE